MTACLDFLLVEVIERVIEVFWLTLRHWIVEVVRLVALVLETTWLAIVEAVATWTTLTALLTRTTLTTLRTWTALTLYVSLWFRNEYTV